MDNFKKKTLNKSYWLLCLLTLLLCVCADVPEHCSDHNPCNPSTQFCYEGKAVDKCGGKDYDPSKQGCCGGKGYDLSTQGCYSGVIRSDANTLTVNITSTSGGTVSRNPNKINYKWGESVTVTATAASEYTFMGWSGAATDRTESVTVIMDGNKTLTANFQPIQEYTLAVSVDPSGGGSVSCEPNQTTYTTGTTVTVTATAASGYTFKGWSGAATDTTESVTVIMDGNKTLTANFQQIQYYTLTTSVSPSGGGSVSLNPNQTSYTSGTSVTVTATAASGYTFNGWSGASTATNSSVTITMDSNKALTANFQKEVIATYTLTTSVSPVGGGSVSLSPSQTNYTYGTDVTVTATAASGYTFKGWSGASTSTSSSVTITMNGNKTITADFYWNNTCGKDGTANSCKSVTIGSQTWMAENLNYKVADGTGSWCYENSADNCAKYGRLYDWETAMTACPSGWHLPSRDEWNNLVSAVGSPAGTKLKSKDGWSSGNGTDDFGCSALPGGYRDNDGYRFFHYAGSLGYWWTTTTEGGSSIVYSRYMGYDRDYVYEGSNYKRNGFWCSVRCVKND
jgi:uncharacterized protein (TIGR02145 family)/uncharacterized repeat protein (TIGR02543 family)